MKHENLFSVLEFIICLRIAWEVLNGKKKKKKKQEIKMAWQVLFTFR